jgi:hypothetical protein
MERDELHSWRKWDLVVNALLIGVTLMTLASVAWGLDTRDAGCQQSEYVMEYSSPRPLFTGHEPLEHPSRQQSTRGVTPPY